jgi:hypothetical protein
MEIGGGDSFAKAYTVDVEDYQNLKETEDRASDVLLCLDSTLDTVTTIKSMYCRCLKRSGDTTSECVQEDDGVLFALDEKEKDVAYSRKKVSALLFKARNTRALVWYPVIVAITTALTIFHQISSLLERLNGHNLDQQMFALQNLQRQAQDENAIMRKLAEQGSRDSASVRILTVLTLIYLPTAVVSVSRLIHQPTLH